MSISILFHINNDVLHKLPVKKTEVLYIYLFQWESQEWGVLNVERWETAVSSWITAWGGVWARSTINVSIWQHIEMAPILSLQREVQGIM